MREERQPASEEITEVAPGILRLQLPISMPGLGHVNCYALEDERGFALVDPGLPGPASWRALVARLEAAGTRIANVHTVIVTHSHPDHFGGAGTVRHESGAEIISHTAFRSFLDAAEDEREQAAAANGGRLRGPSRSPWDEPPPWGGKPPAPPRQRRVAYAVMRRIRPRYMRAPTPSRRVEDGTHIRLGRRDWVALHTPGHTADHLCLHQPDEGIVLAGDHVLPTITPHISGLAAAPDEHGGDALAAFFASLERVERLTGVTTVLPAHGHPFTDLAGRARAIRVHHEERLDLLRAAAHEASEASVAEFSRRLFAERSWGPMAESETYAHLEHLRRAGELTSRRLGEHLHYRVAEPA